RASFVDAIARREKLHVLVDGMTTANDLGLTTTTPARSTIYADTYPRTIAIEANAGDPRATASVVYVRDFKRISAKSAFWADGRPCVIRRVDAGVHSAHRCSRGAGLGMLIVETIARIRRAHFVKGKPIKAI